MRICIFLAVVIVPAAALADAIVVSRAMFASTIAEYFVEPDYVRVELEIGVNDLGAFRNLLPDAVYQEMGYGQEPMEERLDLFFGRDLAVFSGDRPLKGGIYEIGPETRIKRDAVTGEPLPEGEEEPEVVIAATLIFPYDNPPEQLTLVAPSETGMASIGFVLYHRDVAVNDLLFLRTLPPRA